RQIFAGNATLGDAVLAAKRAVSDLDVRRTWVLFGDPAMRLHQLPAAVASPIVTTTATPADTTNTPTATSDVAEAASLTAQVLAADVRLADVDGDGRADAWLYNPGDGRWSAALANQDGARAWQGVWPVDSQVSAARLNGDRLADVLIVNRA